jgi:starch-binding outer membrane protein, SusD/RagB family
MIGIGDPGTSAERHQVNNFNMDANNGMIARYWPEFYNIVSSQNAAIFGVGQITADATVKNMLIGEARFIRAFAYYNLVRLFGDIPHIEEFVTDPDAVKTISKTPEAEVYQKIIADLLFAKENLPDKHTADVRSRATKGTAASYLAQVYLTIGDFSKAAEEAKWIITNKSRFNYGLASNYQDLFNAEKVSALNEPIFVVDFLAQFRASDNTNFDQMGKTIAVNRANPANAGVAAVYRGFAAGVPSMNVY